MILEISDKEYNSLIGAVGAVMAFCSDKKFPELESIYSKLLKLKLK